MFFELGPSRIACVAGQQLVKRKVVVGLAGRPWQAVEPGVQPKHGIEGRHRPVAAVYKMRTASTHRTPRKRKRPAVVPGARGPNISGQHVGRAVRSLHGRNHAQLAKALQVCRRDQLYVLNAMAAVTRAVQALDLRKAIQCAPHRAIATAVHRHLQTHAVTSGRHANEMLKAEERITARMRRIRIRRNQQRSVAFQDAIHEELGSAAAHKRAAHRLHLGRRREHLQCGSWRHMIRHVHAQVHFVHPLHGLIELHLLQVAIHVVHTGNAGGVEQLHGVQHKLALARSARVRKELAHRLHGPCLAQLASGHAGRIAHNHAVGAAGLAAIQDARLLQRAGIGPRRVSVVGCHQQRPVRRHRIQLPARADDVVAQALPAQARLAGVRVIMFAQQALHIRDGSSGLQLRMAEPNRAPKQMQVAVNETRQQCALLRIHHARGRPLELRAVFRAAHSHNARSPHRNRRRPRHNQVLREHPCV